MMSQCRICSYDIPDTARFCGGCGAPAGANSAGPTRTPAPSATTPTPREGRFAPGALLAGRYRILGLAGRGGMGEVYRAHDSKLDQVVALKFLPETLRQNVAALVRLHNEVRVARQVSHPNVCRVYDVGEAEGLHFLTMEYIDGEDLSHLLKRIGRFPQDKGVEIARKLCLAVAAAHDRGVLHRDLKPANIMLNAAGQVLVTDFGLAAVAKQLRGSEAANGTPAYMAPEQWEGREVTARSDIYSLGLVLYEIFTGKRAVTGGNRRELSHPSSVVPDIDPAVERVIMRCLSESPGDRPATPLAVAKALPGGDPLEAALAAGETPSPEMVAAAGEQAGISVRAAALCLLGVVACLAIILAVGDRFQIAHYTPLDLPPAALAAKAREIAAAAGYPRKPADRAFGFDYDIGFVSRQKSNADWERAREGRPTAIQFWYRESPAPLAPAGIGGASLMDPPFSTPGMVSMRLDTAGRLMWFQALPSPELAKRGDTDWGMLFAAAGLDLRQFEEITSERMPPVPFDTRKAWKGAYAGPPDLPVFVDAASAGERSVYFRVLHPWALSDQEAQFSEAIGTLSLWMLLRPEAPAAATAVFLTLILAAAVLAWRNLRNGRGDRTGALRLAVFVIAMRFIAGLAAGDLNQFHTSLGRLYLTVGPALWRGFVAWAAYLAVEPVIRRKWPQSLISWNRMLAGRLRDPLLGRDLLLGVLGGCATVAVIPLWAFLAPDYGLLAGTPLPNGAAWLIVTAALLLVQPMSGLLNVFLFATLWRVSGRRWVAAAGVWVWTALLAVVVMIVGRRADVVEVALLLAGVLSLPGVFVLVRFGVTAYMAAGWGWIALLSCPTGLQFSAWHQNGGQVMAAVVLLVAVYGFHSALGGRPLLARGGDEF